MKEIPYRIMEQGPAREGCRVDDEHCEAELRGKKKHLMLRQRKTSRLSSAITKAQVWEFFFYLQ